MKGSKYIAFLLLLLLLSSNKIFSTVYYISSSTGDDNNSGLSESSPWKTIAKVNSIKYLPGDKILFKKGDQWQHSSGLLIKNSGTANNRILYGAYGAGNKPIISARTSLPGWNTTSNWTNISTNIWRFNFSDAKLITRLWLSNVEYRESKNIDNGTNLGIFSVNSINSTDRWNSDNGYIYVYATSNPATHYNNIQVACISALDRACKITLSDYVTIENIDFQAGYECVQVEGSDYLIIQDCNIGKLTRNSGIFVYNSSNLRSDKGIIRRNVVDHGVISNVPYWHVNTSAGIYLASGSSFWKVHDNFVKDWSLAGIDVLAATDSSTYNEIYNNEVSAPNMSYGRALQVSGATSNNPNFKASNNKIYNNYFHDCNVRIQFTGSNNEFSYNIVANISDSYNDFPLDHAQNTSGQGFNILGSSDNANYNNKIYNNTFYNCARAAIFLQVNGGTEKNHVYNNLLLNCGDKEGTLKYAVKYTGGAINTVYKNNLFWYANKGASDFLILTSRNGGEVPPHIFGYARTVTGFNDENGKDGNIVSDNIQHVGSLTTLVKNAALNDFSLIDGSPAINSGKSEPWMRITDFNGNSINGSRDIGAIEFSGILPTQNSAPIINSVPVSNVVIGNNYLYDVNASGNPNPTYKLITSPVNMIINSSTGLIQWMPANTGTFNVSVEANNGVDPASVQSFTILVTENNSSGDSSVVPTGIVSYWKLDEITGSIFMDAIGSNNATALSIPLAATGIINGAQKFNGSTAKLDIPANKSIDFLSNENFSVEFWYNGSVNPTTVKSAIGRFIKSTGAKWWVGLNANDGKARFFMSGGGSSVAINGPIITDGKWHHIVATRNGKSGSIKLYVDGLLCASTIKNIPADFVSSTENLNIGWFSFQQEYTLSGILDEVAFYKTELNSVDINDHYTKGIKGQNYIGIAQQNFVTVSSKIFLQGAYNGLDMNTHLSLNSSIPLIQPYSSAPWGYNGTEKVNSIPANIVDWVLVELRTGTGISSIVRKRAGLLRKDGQIVDLDGVSKLKFDDMVSGNYYLVIKHRNHLDIMSSSPVSIAATSPSYDFTKSSSQAYGTSSLTSLGNNTYGLISGDGDANGNINVLDYGVVSRSYNQSGYLPGDYDLNNIVDVNDYKKSGDGLFNNTKVPQ